MSGKSDKKLETESKEEINEPIAENKDEIVETVKDEPKKAPTGKKKAKKEVKSKEAEKVESHIEKHLLPQTKRIVDKTEVNEEVKTSVPTYKEEAGFWAKLKKKFKR